MKRSIGLWLGLAILGCKTPEDDIRQKLRSHLNLPYAPDEVIELLDVKPDSAVARIYADTFRVYYLIRKDRTWTVSYEIDEEFKKSKMNDLEFEKEFLQRMGTRMQERFNRAITIKPGIPKTVSFEESNKTVVAKVAAIFNASPSPGHVMDFWYCETHRFKDGQWTYDSFTLLERVPMKNDNR